MSLAELVPEAGVIADLNATSKKHLFQELADRAGDLFSMDARVIFDAVLERERLGSTGIGAGIAIPHARLPEMEHVQAVFARLTTPVDFDAVDELPVDLVFLLLAPQEASAEHLKALARISRAMKRSEFAERLRGAVGEDAVRALLVESANVEPPKPSPEGTDIV